MALLQRLINDATCHYDSVYIRENAMVPFGTIQFGAEQFQASRVDAKRFHMATVVSTMEDICVFNHKNPAFFGIWLVMK